MSPPPLAADIERITVVMPSWVGDCVMATPLLRNIRSHRPDAHLSVVLRPGLDEIIRGAPWLDEIVTSPFKGLAGPFLAANAIRATRSDAVLLLPNSFRAGVIARLAGAPVRIGYRRDGRGWLLTHTLDVERSATPTPTVHYYNRLGSFALGVGDLDPHMELFVTPEQHAKADRLLEGVSRPFILLNPGGNKLPKRWPPDRFAAVACALHSECGVDVVVSGAPSEMDVLRAVVEAAEPDCPIVNLADRSGGLGALKSVIQRSALVITNDTGPRHIAAALGTPLVTLFGPTDPRWTTIDAPSERILVAEPFLPEELVADDHPRLCNIERISVSDVVHAALGLLSASNPDDSPPEAVPGTS